MEDYEKHIEEIKKDFPKWDVKLSEPFEIIENAEQYEKEYKNSLGSWSKDSLFVAFMRVKIGLVVYGVAKDFDLKKYLVDKNELLMF